MFTIPLPPGGGQIPNDCNQDGLADISDAVCVLGHLFLNDPPIVPFDADDPDARPCGDGTINHPAARALLDANEDGAIDISDAVVLLGYLFLGDPPPLNGVACKRIVDCQEVCVAQ